MEGGEGVFFRSRGNEGARACRVENLYFFLQILFYKVWLMKLG